MTDISYYFDKISHYIQHPDEVIPTTSDMGQAVEIEKLRQAISDMSEAKRRILPEYQELAAEVVCLEIARQILKEQRGE